MNEGRANGESGWWVGHLVGVYAAFSSLWILVSDRVVGLLFPDHEALVVASTWKGLAFVVVTSSLLFGLLWRYRRQLRASRAALEQSERTLRSYVEHAPLAVFVAARDGRYLDANPAACAMTGYTLAELRRLTIPELVPPEAGGIAARAFAEVKDRGHVTVELPLRRKDGQPVWVSLVAVGLPDGTLLAQCTDITTQRQHIRELTLARDAAEAGRRAKDEFLATMSHELRTPLNGVLGMAQLLEGTSLGDEQRADLGTLQRSAQDLLGLIDDVLEFSRLEAGHVSPAPTSVAPRALLEAACQPHAEAAARKGLRLEVVVAPDVPARVDVDAEHLQRVLEHLVGNAVKFTPAGAVSLAVGVTERQGEALLLSFQVKDTGVGLTPEVLERLFTPFSPGDGSRQRRFGGMGLGLALCQRLAQVLDARLWAQSEPGQGSTFHLVAPVTLSPGAPTPEGPPAPPPLVGGTGPLTVLVAEDHAVNRHYAQAVLTRLGHQVLLAEDGLEALELLRARAVDVVLLDVSMPLMSGEDVLRAIRAREAEQGGHLPVLAVTGWSGDRSLADWQGLGFDGLLAKPWSSAQLSAALTRVMRQSAPPRTMS